MNPNALKLLYPHLFRYAKKDASGEERWITIGGQKNDEGKRKGGFPVLIGSDGEIKASAVGGLHGKNVSEVKGHFDGKKQGKQEPEKKEEPAKQKQGESEFKDRSQMTRDEYAEMSKKEGFPAKNKDVLRHQHDSAILHELFRDELEKDNFRKGIGRKLSDIKSGMLKYNSSGKEIKDKSTFKYVDGKIQELYKEAQAAGKTIPDEVLKDYPELASKPPAKPQESPGNPAPADDDFQLKQESAKGKPSFRHELTDAGAGNTKQSQMFDTRKSNPAQGEMFDTDYQIPDKEQQLKHAEGSGLDTPAELARKKAMGESLKGKESKQEEKPRGLQEILRETRAEERKMGRIKPKDPQRDAKIQAHQKRIQELNAERSTLRSKAPAKPAPAAKPAEPSGFNPEQSYAVDGKEPWEMTALEWRSAADKYRPATGGGVGKVGPQVSNRIKGDLQMQLARMEKLKLGLPDIVSPEDASDRRSPGHREVVEAAIKAGKKVPPSVLAEYPELRKGQYSRRMAGLSLRRQYPHLFRRGERV